MINNYHIKERFSHHHFINESSASVWVSLLCELQKITIFSPNCPDDRTIDLHSLRMIMELLSTISIITHNGLNGLFVPPWQRRLVKHAMLPCKQAQLVRRIHGSIRPGASLQENVPTAHPVLTQVLNTGRCLVLCHTSTSSPSLRLLSLKRSVHTQSKSATSSSDLWRYISDVKTSAFFPVSWHLSRNHEWVLIHRADKRRERLTRRTRFICQCSLRFMPDGSMNSVVRQFKHAFLQCNIYLRHNSGGAEKLAV